MKFWSFVLLVLTPCLLRAQGSLGEIPAAKSSMELKEATLSAQDTSKKVLIEFPDTEGKVNIKQSKRIDDLTAKYDNMKHVQKGYRVQIFLGSRQGQSRAKAKFESLYPKYVAYLDYQAPNFKVRVGDFKKRMDAERLLMLIRKDFSGAYIVPDEVELNRIP